MGSPKAGPYPMADRANIFGTMYVSFYDRWNAGGTRDQCWPIFEGILGIAHSKADQKFKEAYRRLAYHGPDCLANQTGRCREGAHVDGAPKRDLNLAEMSGIVREAWALMDRIGTYDYTGEEFAEEYDLNAREEDVVSEGHPTQA